MSGADPRLSVQERYPNHGAYVSSVAHAVNDAVRQRVLLREDADRIVDAAGASSIGKK